LPGEDEHFIILEPFVPVSSQNSQTRLVAFLTANSDPGHYGELQSFVMPQGQNVSGPAQVNNQILRTSAISAAITLIGRQGSSISQGSLQLIPVGNTIVYVRPFYARGTGTANFPQFQFVVVYAQGPGAYCGQTIDDALNQLLGRTPRAATCNVSAVDTGTDNGSTSSTTTTTTTTPGTATTATTAPPANSTQQQLLDQAAAKLDQAQQALENGGPDSLGTYQRLVNEAQDLIRQAQQKAGG
jgi:uncharacterized membrane protein (UPF0182 family)